MVSNANALETHVFPAWGRLVDLPGRVGQAVLAPVDVVLEVSDGLLRTCRPLAAGERGSTARCDAAEDLPTSLSTSAHWARLLGVVSCIRSRRQA